MLDFLQQALKSFFCFYVSINFQILGKTSVKTATDTQITTRDESNGGFITKENKKEDAVAESKTNPTESDLLPTLFDTDKEITLKAVGLCAKVARNLDGEALIDAKSHSDSNKPVASDEQIDKKTEAVKTNTKASNSKQITEESTDETNDIEEDVTPAAKRRKRATFFTFIEN